MAVSVIFYDSVAISPVPFILSQIRESHPALSLGERNVSLGDNVQVERASAFFKLIERNLGLQKGIQSPLQILLKHAVPLSDPDVNSPVIAAMKQAFFKQEGYLARLFSKETWEEWTENRTALGEVASQFRNCIESHAEVCSFTKVMNPQLIQKANEESSVLLKRFSSREVTRTSKGSCLYGLTSGIAASFLLKNPLLFLLGLSECFPRAYTQQKVGNEFQVNTYTNNSQTKSSVASFPNGNFVVTWMSYGQDGSDYGVYGQLFDGNGTKIGSEFRVNNYITDAQEYPSVASLNNGNFVVTWSSYAQDGSEMGVYGQLFNGNGTKIGSEFRANNYTTGHQAYPSVASFSNGNFVVTWSSSGQDGSSDGIYGQLFDGNGTKLGSEFRANSYTTDGQWFPSVASFSNSNFVVTWTSSGQDGSFSGIYGQLFDGNGTKIGNEFRVNSYTSMFQDSSSVASFSNGNFVVTWDSFGQNGPDYEVSVQLFNGNGTKIGSEFRANIYRFDYQIRSSVASFSNGNFVVTWLSGGSPDYMVYGQLFDENGTKIGNEFQVNTYRGSENPSVASFSNGNFVVIWSNYYARDGSEAGVYGQIFNDVLIPSSTTISSSTTSTTSTFSTSTAILASSTHLTSSIPPSSTSTAILASSTHPTSSIPPSSTSTAILASSTHLTSSIPPYSTSTAILASSTHPTSSIPSSTLASILTFSTPKASSPPKRIGLITWISLGVGGLICFCVTPLSFLLLRKRQSQRRFHFSGEKPFLIVPLPPLVLRDRTLRKHDIDSWFPKEF